MRVLAPLLPNLAPWRASRDYRLLVVGNFVSGVGTQAVLVALPYQVYIETRSALLTGLLGAAELVPLVATALIGGAMADRYDRRRLVLLDQYALVALSGMLAVLAFLGDPPIPALFVLGGLLAGANALQNVVRTAMVPNLVPPELIREGVSFVYGLHQLTIVLGPGLGGLLIGWQGVGSAYTLDAISCLAMVAAAIPLPAQLPKGAGEVHESVFASIRDGLRFVSRKQALMGSFGMDLVAMGFGMPRALFPALSVSVYGAGAEGAGLLLASVAVGATAAAIMTGWVSRVRRLGVVVAWAVVAWGLAVAAAGIVGNLWLAAALFAVAGVADSVSAVCRGAINQLVTPDHLRGRMSSTFSIVVTSGPRLGDIESGVAAALTSVRTSVVSGGVACVVGVGAIALAFPALLRFDAEDPSTY